MSRTGTQYLDAHPHAPLTSYDVHVREEPDEEEDEEERKDEDDREEGMTMATKIAAPRCECALIRRYGKR